MWWETVEEKEIKERERVHVVLAARSTSFFKLFRGGGGHGSCAVPYLLHKTKSSSADHHRAPFFYLVEGSLA